MCGFFRLHSSASTVVNVCVGNVFPWVSTGLARLPLVFWRRFFLAVLCSVCQSFEMVNLLFRRASAGEGFDLFYCLGGLACEAVVPSCAHCRRVVAY